MFDLPFSLYSTFVIEDRHGFNEVRELHYIVLSLSLIFKFYFS